MFICHYRIIICLINSIKVMVIYKNCLDIAFKHVTYRILPKGSFIYTFH